METETLDVAGKKLSLVEAFANLPDPRVVGRSKHDLTEMLVVAVCALVCGVDDFVGIQRWAEERIDWLRTFLKLENGIPSHDTLARLFGLLDQAAVEKGFRRWVGSVLPALAEGSVLPLMAKPVGAVGGPANSRCTWLAPSQHTPGWCWGKRRVPKSRTN